MKILKPLNTGRAQFRHCCAPTGIEGDCIWCGRKLRRKLVRTTEPFTKQPVYPKAGANGDGYFCTLRCAYEFACVLADAGRRVSPGGD